MNSIYRLQNLRQKFQNREVLRINDLSIAAGKILGLVGPNGSGKSTLLSLLAFLRPPTEGIILYKGRPAPTDHESRRHVTLLDQDAYLLKRSVFENIAYGLRVRRETHDIELHINEAMDMVGLPPDKFSRRKWFELSGGEAQRVALAARLVLRPEVLLLDEPTSSVDVASAQRMHEAVLEAKNSWKTTLVIASHDQTWLHGVCDTYVDLTPTTLNEQAHGATVESR